MAIPVLAAANALGAHVGGEPAISENRPSLTTSSSAETSGVEFLLFQQNQMLMSCKGR